MNTPAELTKIAALWQRKYPQYAPLEMYSDNLDFRLAWDSDENKVFENDGEINNIYKRYKESPYYKVHSVKNDWNDDTFFHRPVIEIEEGTRGGIVVKNLKKVQAYVKKITDSNAYKALESDDPEYYMSKTYDEDAVKLLRDKIIPYLEIPIRSKYDVVIYTNQHGEIQVSNEYDDMEAHRPPKGRHVTILQAVPAGVDNHTVLETVTRRTHAVFQKEVNDTGEINALELQKRLRAFSARPLKTFWPKKTAKRSSGYLKYLISSKWNLFEDSWTERYYGSDKILNSLDVWYDKFGRLPPDIKDAVVMHAHNLQDCTRSDVLEYLWAKGYKNILLLDDACAGSDELSTRAVRRLSRRGLAGGSRRYYKKSCPIFNVNSYDKKSDYYDNSQIK